MQYIPHNQKEEGQDALNRAVKAETASCRESRKSMKSTAETEVTE